MIDPNRFQCLNCGGVGQKSLPCWCNSSKWIHRVAIFLSGITALVFYWSVSYWSVFYSIILGLLIVVLLIIAANANNYRSNQRTKNKNNFEQPLMVYGLLYQPNQTVQTSKQYNQESKYLYQESANQQYQYPIN